MKLGILISGRGSNMVAIVDAVKSGAIPDSQVAVEIKRGSWPEPPIFGMMQRLGNVADHEMFRTFNMGVGTVVVCSAENKNEVISAIPDCGESGLVTAGESEVSIK